MTLRWAAVCVLFSLCSLHVLSKPKVRFALHGPRGVCHCCRALVQQYWTSATCFPRAGLRGRSPIPSPAIEVVRYLVGAGKAIGVDIWGDSWSCHIGTANGFDLGDDPEFGIVQELKPVLREMSQLMTDLPIYKTSKRCVPIPVTLCHMIPGKFLIFWVSVSTSLTLR